MKIKLLLLFLAISILLSSCKPQNKDSVCFKNSCFNVDLAVTSEEHSKGLMFRNSLELDQGMLFIFESEDMHSFWMKNTLIPLDIIWINSKMEVVHVSKDVQPCTTVQCSAINPKVPSKYVLEINAGLSDKLNMTINDTIKLNINTILA